MKKILLVAATATALLANLTASEVTEINITDKVLQKAVSPLGINMGGDSYYSPPKLKVRFEENFEGTIYRQAHNGILSEDGFMSYYCGKATYNKWWEKLNLKGDFYLGGEVLLISGPLKGTKVKIKELGFVDYQFPWKKKPQGMVKFMFDKKIALPDGKPIKDAGIMINIDRSGNGCMGKRKSDSHWKTSNADLVHDDLFPGGFGKTALLLDGTKIFGKYNANTMEFTPDKRGRTAAHFRCYTSKQKFMDLNKKWHIKFKAKIKEGEPVYRIIPGGTKPKMKAIVVELTKEWKEYDIVVDVKDVPEYDGNNPKSNPFLDFVLQANNGKVLIDDISLAPETEDKNPTVFTDDFVNMLKLLKPGILRKLMMGGVLKDALSPRLESYRATNSIVAPTGPFQNRGHIAWGIGQSFELCEEVGCEAWFGVPGTLMPGDMEFFMEYLGGPAGTLGGDLRIKHGHPKPWTESLKQIHVEIGNEAWNTMFGFIAGGYNGPDYWEDNFKAGKASPYYKKNVLFHSAGQNYSTGMSKRILKDTPSSDRYSIAPYQIHKLAKKDLENWATLEEFYKYCLTYPRETIKYSMPKQGVVSKATGVEFSIYEMSWHLTGGDIMKKTKNHEPKLLEWTNNFVTSVPAAMGHFDHMLSLLKNFGLRSMCHFTLTGDYYEVRLWGSVLSMKKGAERLRPMGQAFAMINDKMKGDLVETVISGKNPSFSGTGHLANKKRSKKAITVENPSITTYAFKDGKTHTLIIMNMDLKEAQDIKISFPGTVNGKVTSQLLQPNKFDDNNEWEAGVKGKVDIKDLVLDNFTNGGVITIQPATLQTFRWSE